jgi:hypothetical protein
VTKRFFALSFELIDTPVPHFLLISQFTFCLWYQDSILFHDF